MKIVININQNTLQNPSEEIKILQKVALNNREWLHWKQIVRSNAHVHTNERMRMRESSLIYNFKQYLNLLTRHVRREYLTQKLEYFLSFKYIEI